MATAGIEGRTGPGPEVMSPGAPATSPRADEMDWRGLLTLLGIEIVALVGGTILFVALFHTPLLGGMTVLFYRGIGLLGVATVITVIALVALRRRRFRRLIGLRDILLVAALLFSGNLVFFTHFPVTADRSVSVFMLGYLDGRAGGLSKAEIETVLVNRYIVAGAAAEKRIEEQIVSGNLALRDGHYQITDQGRALMDSYRVIAWVFGVAPGNVSP